MPILNNIKVAEQKAETLRQSAIKDVELLLEKTKSAAEQRANKILDAATDTIKSLKQEMEEKIKKNKNDNIKNIENDKVVLENLAKQNEEFGINYILKKVVEI